MKILFYGTLRHAGCSTNCRITGEVLSFFCYPKVSVTEEKERFFHADPKEILLFDGSSLPKEAVKECMKEADLIFLNTNQEGEGLDPFFSNGKIKSHIMLLIGKFIPCPRDIRRLSRIYRLPEEDILSLPYSQQMVSIFQGRAAGTFLQDPGESILAFMFGIQKGMEKLGENNGRNI